MTADTCAHCHHVHSDRFPWCDNPGLGGIACVCSQLPSGSVAPPTPTTESVDDYEGWAETAFLPSVKYAVLWDEARDGWRVLTLDDGGAFA